MIIIQKSRLEGAFAITICNQEIYKNEVFHDFLYFFKCMMNLFLNMLLQKILQIGIFINLNRVVNDQFTK